MRCKYEIRIVDSQNISYYIILIVMVYCIVIVFFMVVVCYSDGGCYVNDWQVFVQMYFIFQLFVFICIMFILEFECILYGVCKQFLYRFNYENRKLMCIKYIYVM